MGFLETIIRAFDGCVGLLEVLTVVFVAAAVYRGVRTYRKHQHAVEKLAHDPKAHVKKPTWWPAAVLVVIALAFTALTVVKYVHGPG